MARTLQSIKRRRGELIYSRNVADDSTRIRAPAALLSCVEAFSAFKTQESSLSNKLPWATADTFLSCRPWMEKHHGLNSALQSLSRKWKVSAQYFWMNCLTPSEFIWRWEAATKLMCLKAIPIPRPIIFTGNLGGICDTVVLCSHKWVNQEYIGMVRENNIVGETKESHETMRLKERNDPWSFIGWAIKSYISMEAKMKM